MIFGVQRDEFSEARLVPLLDCRGQAEFPPELAHFCDFLLWGFLGETYVGNTH